jgi:geranylgeranyl diphosphate synthase type II
MTQEEYSRRASAYRDEVEVGLRRLLPEPGEGEIPALLAKAMRYSLLAGGKRLRPVLLMAAADMLGGGEGALTCACALEMIHTYSLIHDDLPGMDGDTLRRGKPTNHVVFGEGQAILAGDGLLTYAFECVLSDAAKRGDSAALREMRALGRIASAAGCGGMVAGQCADLACERAAGQSYVGIVRPDEVAPAQDMLLYIHRRKTARMIMAPFEAACELAGADEAVRGAMMRFAEPFGLLFQVVDDYLDACGDSAALGKSVGKDASSGKLTYVSLYGVERTLALRDELVAQARAALCGIPNSGFWACELEAMAYRDR